MEKILKAEIEPGITFKTFLMRELLEVIKESYEVTIFGVENDISERDIKAAVRYLFL
jgi:hypothetical protein